MTRWQPRRTWRGGASGGMAALPSRWSAGSTARKRLEFCLATGKAVRPMATFVSLTRGPVTHETNPSSWRRHYHSFLNSVFAFITHVRGLLSTSGLRTPQQFGNILNPSRVWDSPAVPQSPGQPRRQGEVSDAAEPLGERPREPGGPLSACCVQRNKGVWAPAWPQVSENQDLLPDLICS